jgi:hypothetical protein
MPEVDASDELQRLDDDLAAGRVDATSYRRRRDELIVRRREEEAAARATGPSAVGAVEVPTTGAVDPAPGSAGTGPSAPATAGEPASSGPGSDGSVAPSRTSVPAHPSPATPSAATPSGAHPATPDPVLPSSTESRTEPPDSGPDTESIPVVTPGTAPGPPPGAPHEPRGPDPFPPPFRWGDTQAPSDPAPEVTQVVERDAESTQVVPGPSSGGFRPAGGPTPTGPPPADPAGFRPPSFAPPPERTQVVPGGIAGRRPSAPVPAAHTTPPWVDRAPDRVDRSPSGMQGSEVFLGRRRELASVIGTAAVIAVVILVLVLSFTLG